MESENRTTLILIILAFTMITTSIIYTVSIYEIEKNINTLYGNQEVLKADIDTMISNFNDFRDEFSMIIPKILKSHNTLVESTILNDSEVINSSAMFSEAMREFNDTDLLDSFDDCMQATKNRFIVNYVMLDGTIFFGTKEILGIEIAVYDKDLDYKHTQSMYITRDFVKYDIFDCASLTFIKDKNSLDIELNVEVFNETVEIDGLEMELEV